MKTDDHKLIKDYTQPDAKKILILGNGVPTCAYHCRMKRLREYSPRCWYQACPFITCKVNTKCY